MDDEQRNKYAHDLSERIRREEKMIRHAIIHTKDCTQRHQITRATISQ